MKTKRSPKFLKMLKQRNPLEIAKADYPVEDEVLENVSLGMAGQSRREQTQADASIAETLERALASIATYAWKAKSRLKDAVAVEDGGVSKRVSSDLDRILNVLEGNLKWEIRDHTGKDFDYGMALTVVTTQPMVGLHRERVIETIKPTIYDKNDNDRIIQIGAVVIATPA